jgi:molybdopterin-guanine dinucleotide biosynthesis protein A/hemerythrin-like domain-containing protein
MGNQVLPFGGGVMKLRGIVLAGGKSSRFGSDKALALLDGKTLLERSVALLDTMGLGPTVITSEARHYGFLSCRVEKDLIPEIGPLGGLYTASKLFPESTLVVLTCDMTQLTHRVLKTLLHQHEIARRATLFKFDQAYFQPFPGIYESSLSWLAHQQIEKGELSLQSFLNEIEEKKVLTPRFSPQLFTNVNEPKDLKKESQMAEEKVFSYYQTDHTRLDQLFKEFQLLKRKEFQKAKNAFKNFQAGLKRHIVWEEEILFPVFETKTGHANGGPTEVMRVEHQKIKIALEAIHGKVRQADPESDAEEAELINVLSEHNRKEEQILYPMIDQVTTPDERQAIFEKMKAIPLAGPDSCCGIHPEAS